jgi:hypothetical protein
MQVFRHREANYGDNYIQCLNVDRYQYVLETGQGMNHSKVLHVFPRGSQPDSGDTSRRTYFVIDTDNDAFAHWVVESFIFVSLLTAVVKQFPQVQVLTNNRKRYVGNLLRWAGVHAEVVHEIEAGSPNVCFFPAFIVTMSTLNPASVDVPLLHEYLNTFCDTIRPLPAPRIELLYLPRNQKENYTPNDYQVLGTEDMTAGVIAAGGTVVDTFHLNNMDLQFALISNAATIITDFGSAYCVNGLFVRNKKIVVIDSYRKCSMQSGITLGIPFLHRHICERNQVTLVHPKSNTAHIGFDDVRHLI